jgi:flagellar basal body-associated protein FliL
VKLKPKYCPALSTGAIVGIVIACVVVVGVVAGVLVYFFVINPKESAVTPLTNKHQEALTSGPAKTF